MIDNLKYDSLIFQGEENSVVVTEEPKQFYDLGLIYREKGKILIKINDGTVVSNVVGATKSGATMVITPYNLYNGQVSFTAKKGNTERVYYLFNLINNKISKNSETSKTPEEIKSILLDNSTLKTQLEKQEKELENYKKRILESKQLIENLVSTINKLDQDKIDLINSLDKTEKIMSEKIREHALIINDKTKNIYKKEIIISKQSSEIVNLKLEIFYLKEELVFNNSNSNKININSTNYQNDQPQLTGTNSNTSHVSRQDSAKKLEINSTHSNNSNPLVQTRYDPHQAPNNSNSSKNSSSSAVLPDIINKFK